MCSSVSPQSRVNARKTLTRRRTRPSVWTSARAQWRTRRGPRASRSSSRFGRIEQLMQRGRSAFMANTANTRVAPVAPPAPLVLVVDDDPAVCRSIARLLRVAGIEARTFASTEGLTVGFARPTGPCCLVLDVNLPDVGGLEYVETLRRAGVRIPVVFITGV